MKLSAQNQSSLHITSSPFENYGFITLVVKDGNADCFRFCNMGNLLYTRNFNLPKNHSGQHSLNFDGHLPNGFLYHKFSFEDGSFKTYPTIKQ